MYSFYEAALRGKLLTSQEMEWAAAIDAHPTTQPEHKESGHLSVKACHELMAQQLLNKMVHDTYLALWAYNSHLHKSHVTAMKNDCSGAAFMLHFLLGTCQLIKIFNVANGCYLQEVLAFLAALQVGDLSPMTTQGNPHAIQY
ncbi:hypothetical protein FRC06_005681, partial [Ceratobasidium sp. 370]